MAKRYLVVFLAGCLVLTLGWGLICVRNVWQSRMNAESKILNERKASVIKSVQLSKLGTHELRDQIASEFLGETTTTDDCDWRAYPTWDRKLSNPNWFSETKGIDGFNVFCETSAHDKHNSGLVIEYDIEGCWYGFEIVGIKWRYTEYD